MINDRIIEFLKEHAETVKIPIHLADDNSALPAPIHSPGASVHRVGSYGIDDDGASLLTAESLLFDHTNEEHREEAVRRKIQEQRRLREQQGDSHQLALMPVVTYPLSRRDKVILTMLTDDIHFCYTVINLLLIVTYPLCTYSPPPILPTYCLYRPRLYSPS